MRLRSSRPFFQNQWWQFVHLLNLVWKCTRSPRPTSVWEPRKMPRLVQLRAGRQAAINSLKGDKLDFTSEAIARRTDGRGEAPIISPLVSTSVLAPQGRNVSAQGRAQRRPGSWFPMMKQPCKGGTNNMAAVCLALSGRRGALATLPPGGASTAVAAALCPGLTCWAPSGRTNAKLERSSHRKLPRNSTRLHRPKRVRPFAPPQFPRKSGRSWRKCAANQRTCIGAGDRSGRAARPSPRRWSIRVRLVLSENCAAVAAGSPRRQPWVRVERTIHSREAATDGARSPTPFLHI